MGEDATSGAVDKTSPKATSIYRNRVVRLQSPGVHSASRSPTTRSRARIEIMRRRPISSRADDSPGPPGDAVVVFPANAVRHPSHPCISGRKFDITLRLQRIGQPAPGVRLPRCGRQRADRLVLESSAPAGEWGSVHSTACRRSGGRHGCDGKQHPGKPM